jgi:ketosteroid isomerase-like protein
MSGTIAAPIEVDGEQREATGARVEVDFIDHITVRDGLISRKDSYLDGLEFERQMGAGG